MSQSRTELKVGLFVFGGLVLLALLLLQFSKGLSLFQSVYHIQLRTSNIGGLKQNAAVLMAGVRVGEVVEASLAPDGKSVSLSLKIRDEFRIHSDARFVIEQSGFLGDQYVAIIPGRNEAPVLKDGDLVEAIEPFNLQEAARAAAGFIDRLDQTAIKLNTTITRIDSVVLNEENLTSLADSIGNLHRFSEQSIVTMDNLRGLVTSNAEPLALSISNLTRFTGQLSEFVTNLNETVITNQADLGVIVANLKDGSENLNLLLDDLQAGEGLIGGLLKDPALKLDASITVSNLAILSSNLNRFGLLYKPRQPRPRPGPMDSIYPGKNPLD